MRVHDPFPMMITLKPHQTIKRRDIINDNGVRYRVINIIEVKKLDSAVQVVVKVREFQEGDKK